MLADSLTVERSKVPGKAFYRKALKYVLSDWQTALADNDCSAFKIQIHKMFLDTSFNSTVTVLSTIYQNFMEAAMKYYRYAKCMGGRKHPHLDLLTGECGRASIEEVR